MCEVAEAAFSTKVDWLCWYLLNLALESLSFISLYGSIYVLKCIPSSES